MTNIRHKESHMDLLFLWSCGTCAVILVYVHIYICQHHTGRPTYTHTRVRTYIHTYIHVHMHAQIHTHLYTLCIGIYIYIHNHTYIHTVKQTQTLARTKRHSKGTRGLLKGRAVRSTRPWPLTPCTCTSCLQTIGVNTPVLVPVAKKEQQSCTHGARSNGTPHKDQGTRECVESQREAWRKGERREEEKTF